MTTAERVAVNVNAILACRLLGGGQPWNALFVAPHCVGFGSKAPGVLVRHDGLSRCYRIEGPHDEVTKLLAAETTATPLDDAACERYGLPRGTWGVR